MPLDTQLLRFEAVCCCVLQILEAHSSVTTSGNTTRNGRVREGQQQIPENLSWQTWYSSPVNPTNGRSYAVLSITG